MRTYRRFPAALTAVLPYILAAAACSLDTSGIRAGVVSATTSSGTGTPGGGGASSGSTKTGGGSGGEGGEGAGGSVIASSSSTGEPPLPFCGDFTVDPGEQCDDGNINNGDGCSDVCQYELTDGCNGTPVYLGHDKVTISGDTTTAKPDATGACCGGASEYIFAIKPMVSGNLVTSLTGSYWTCLWLRDACPDGTVLACEKKSSNQAKVAVDIGDTIYLAADGSAGEVGQFTLEMYVE